MDAEELYNEIIALVESKGLEVPADADDTLSDVCRYVCITNDPDHEDY